MLPKFKAPFKTSRSDKPSKADKRSNASQESPSMPSSEQASADDKILSAQDAVSKPKASTQKGGWRLFGSQSRNASKTDGASGVNDSAGSKRQTTQEKATAKQAAKEKAAEDKRLAQEARDKKRAEHLAAKKKVADEKAAAKQAAREKALQKKRLVEEAKVKQISDKQAARKRAEDGKAAAQQAARVQALEKKRLADEARAKKRADKQAAVKAAADARLAAKKAAEEKIVAQKRAAQDAKAKRLADKEAAAKKVVDDKLAAKKAAADKVAAKKTLAQEARAKKVADRKAAIKKAADDKAAAKQAAADKVAAKKTLAQEARAKKIADKKAAAQKVADDKAAAKKAAADKKAAAKKAAEQKAKNQEIDAPLAYSDLIEEQHSQHFARRAIELSFVAFLAFMVWTAITPVHEITIGEGEILPEGLIQRVQHLEGGIVGRILVQEGVEVNPGDPLLELDNTGVRAEMQRSLARREALRLQIEGERSFVDGREVRFSGDTGLRGLADSHQGAANFKANYRDKQLAVIQSELERSEADLRSLRLRREKAVEELAIVSAQLAEYDQAIESGVISRRERDAIAREQISLEVSLAELDGQIAGAQSSIINAEARQAELEARLRSESLTEIAQLEGELAETEETLVQLQDRLNRTVVRAPVAGQVHNLAAGNTGAVIGPGDLVAEIVPGDTGVFAEVEIPANQVGLISVGLTADIKVLTYDFARFGGVRAEVAHISPSSFLRQEDGSQYFKVRLSLDSAFVGPENQGRRITPGMSIVADIRSGRKSVLAYLLKPLRALSDRALTEA